MCKRWGESTMGPTVTKRSISSQQPESPGAEQHDPIHSQQPIEHAEESFGKTPSYSKRSSNPRRSGPGLGFTTWTIRICNFSIDFRITESVQHSLESGSNVAVLA